MAARQCRAGTINALHEAQRGGPFGLWFAGDLQLIIKAPGAR